MAIEITRNTPSGHTSATIGGALPASPQAGDLHIIWTGAKSYAATFNTISPDAWIELANGGGTNGTTASSEDAGSVHVRCFYRFWQTGDTESITINWTNDANWNTGCSVLWRFRPTAGSTLLTPVATKGNGTTTGSTYTAVMDTDIGVTAGDAIAQLTFVNADNAGGSALGSPGISISGVTVGTVTGTGNRGSTIGDDCSHEGGSALPSSGTSAAAASCTYSILGGTPTGMTTFVRVREEVASGHPAMRRFGGVPYMKVGEGGW